MDLHFSSCFASAFNASGFRKESFLLFFASEFDQRIARWGKIMLNNSRDSSSIGFDSFTLFLGIFLAKLLQLNISFKVAEV